MRTVPYTPSVAAAGVLAVLTAIPLAVTTHAGPAGAALTGDTGRPVRQEDARFHGVVTGSPADFPAGPAGLPALHGAPAVDVSVTHGLQGVHEAPQAHGVHQVHGAHRSSAVSGVPALHGVPAGPPGDRGGGRGDIEAPGAGRAEGSVLLTPATATRGAQVSVRVTGCPGALARAYSEAFAVPASLAPAPAPAAAAPSSRSGEASQTLVARARLRDTVADGTHTVRIACATPGATTGRGATGLVGTLRVRGDGAPGSQADGSTSTSSGSHRDRALAVPGAQAPEAERQVASPGTGQAVISLVLASVAAVAVALRSCRRRTRPGTPPHLGA